jgi:hypothetical protein
MLSPMELSRRIASDFAAGTSGRCGVHAAWFLSRPSLEAEAESASESNPTEMLTGRSFHSAGHGPAWACFAIYTAMDTSGTENIPDNDNAAAASGAVGIRELPTQHLVLRAAPKTAKDLLLDSRPSSSGRP